ncbi:hypothetical protein WUBG_09107 [Wuchereria bancrofti]|uniref:Uncharacterized protein n=1 Tax=Wuchereria bancrofti TaxID=6293 RepID=J9ECS3_WUCBA|nr:hypothetical protein WUBG_09107 [Wuchereria bancrofti]
MQIAILNENIWILSRLIFFSIHIQVKKKKQCYHEKPAYKWFRSTTGKFRSRMFINARRRILVQSKESPDMDFIQESSSNTDCALIPKRIRRLVVNFCKES